MKAIKEHNLRKIIRKIILEAEAAITTDFTPSDKNRYGFDDLDDLDDDEEMKKKIESNEVKSIKISKIKTKSNAKDDKDKFRGFVLKGKFIIGKEKSIKKIYIPYNKIDERNINKENYKKLDSLLLKGGAGFPIPSVFGKGVDEENINQPSLDYALALCRCLSTSNKKYGINPNDVQGKLPEDKENPHATKPDMVKGIQNKLSVIIEKLIKRKKELES